jgi:uncharacterized membrane protein YqaE (UPF0057 family)
MLGVLAILLPPIAVWAYISAEKTWRDSDTDQQYKPILSCLCLWILGVVPGIIYALSYICWRKSDDVMDSMTSAWLV